MRTHIVQQRYPTEQNNNIHIPTKTEITHIIQKHFTISQPHTCISMPISSKHRTKPGPYIQCKISLRYEPQVLSIKNQPQVLSIRNQPQLLSLRNQPQVLSIRDQPQVLSMNQPQIFFSMKYQPQVFYVSYHDRRPQSNIISSSLESLICLHTHTKLLSVPQATYSPSWLTQALLTITTCNQR